MRINISAGDGGMWVRFGENVAGLADDSDLMKTSSPRRNQIESREDLNCERLDVPRMKLFTCQLAQLISR